MQQNWIIFQTSPNPERNVHNVISFVIPFKSLYSCDCKKKRTCESQVKWILPYIRQNPDSIQVTDPRIRSRAERKAHSPANIDRPNEVEKLIPITSTSMWWTFFRLVRWFYCWYPGWQYKLLWWEWYEFFEQWDNFHIFHSCRNKDFPSRC